MSKSNAFETALLEFIFQSLPLTEVDGTATLYASLHTSDPGEAGDQGTNEVSYTPYLRAGVVRSGSGWSVSGNEVNPAAAIDWPQVSSGSGTATHFGVGTEQTGSGYLLYSGVVVPSITLTVGEVPRLTTDTSITED